MSRYLINSDRYLIYVGYDQPLRTFFATVEDLNSLEDEDCLLLWAGINYDEITSVPQLQQAIADYTFIPNELQEQLRIDSQQSFKPSHFQIITEQLFSRLSSQAEK